MYIYLQILIFLGLMSMLCSIGIDKRLNAFFLIIIYIVLLFIAGFKYETGVDWCLYKKIMNHTRPIYSMIADFRSGYYKNEIDIGYTIFLSIIKTFGGGMQTVYFIIASFTLANLIYHFNLYSPNSITAILVYYAISFFVLDMSGVRQCIAVSIFLISLKYVERGKGWQYFITVFIAALIHWSSFLLLPLYFILKRRYSSIKIVVFFLIELLIFFLRVKWLKALLELSFPFISNKKMVEKAVFYTSSAAYATAREFDIITIANIIFYIVLLLFLVRYRTILESKFKYFNVMFNLFLCNLFIYFCTSELIDISSRIQYYFLISNAVLLSYIVLLFKSKIEKAIISILIFFYALGYSKAYVLESIYTIAYHPYQNYIIYTMYDKKSTADYRMEIHKRLHIKKGLLDD